MLVCILCGMLVCGFYMCLNTANIYVILNDGLEKRADVIPVSYTHLDVYKRQA